MKAFLIGLLLTLSTINLCAQDFLQLPDTIYVAITTNDSLPPQFSDNILLEVQSGFHKVNRKNKWSRKFVLAPSVAEADMEIIIDGYRFPTKQQRNSALALSILGIGLPIILNVSGVPVPVAMYFVSSSQYATQIRYSQFMQEQGFQNTEARAQRVGTGYVYKADRGYSKLAKAIGATMYLTAKGWNKAYRKARR
jgi:hypothetical protein